MDLRTELDSTLSGSPSDYAQYLIGDQKLEVDVISWREAEHLYQAVSKLTFLDKEGKRAWLPYRNPSDSCDDRTYVISQVLREMGYSSRKVFAVSVHSSEGHNNLQLSTYYAHDMVITKRPTQDWRHHVAPCIRVKDSSSLGYVEIVIDPSTHNSSRHHHELLPIDEWAGKVSLSEHQSKSLEELKDIMEEVEKAKPKSKYSYYPGVTYIFISSRSQFYWVPRRQKDVEPALEPIRDAIPEEGVYRAYKEKDINGLDGNDRLKCQKKKEPYYYIAAVIREHYWKKDVDTSSDINEVDKIFSYINKIDPDVRSKFPERNYFPNLYYSFKDLLSPSRSKEFEKFFFSIDEEKIREGISQQEEELKDQRIKAHKILWKLLRNKEKENIPQESFENFEAYLDKAQWLLGKDKESYQDMLNDAKENTRLLERERHTDLFNCLKSLSEANKAIEKIRSSEHFSVKLVEGQGHIYNDGVVRFYRSVIARSPQLQKALSQANIQDSRILDDIRFLKLIVDDEIYLSYAEERMIDQDSILNVLKQFRDAFDNFEDTSDSSHFLQDLGQANSEFGRIWSQLMGEELPAASSNSPRLKGKGREG